MDFVDRLSRLIQKRFQGRLYLLTHKGKLDIFFEFQASGVTKIKCGESEGKKALVDILLLENLQIPFSFQEEPHLSDQPVLISFPDLFVSIKDMNQLLIEQISHTPWASGSPQIIRVHSLARKAYPALERAEGLTIREALAEIKAPKLELFVQILKNLKLGMIEINDENQDYIKSI